MPAPHYRRDQNTALTIEQCDENTELFDARTTSNTDLGTAALNKANSVESLASDANANAASALAAATQAETNSNSALSTAQDALDVANNHTHTSGDISFPAPKVAEGSVAFQASGNALDTLNTFRFEALANDAAAYTQAFYRDDGLGDPTAWNKVGEVGLIEPAEMSGLIAQGFEADDQLVFSSGGLRIHDKGRAAQDLSGLGLFIGPNNVIQYRDIDYDYTPTTDTDATDYTLTGSNQVIASITTGGDISIGDYFLSFYATSDTPGQIVVDFKQGATVRKSVTVDVNMSRLIALGGELDEIVDALPLSSGATLSVEMRAVDAGDNIQVLGFTKEANVFVVNDITLKAPVVGVESFNGRNGAVSPIAGDYSAFYSAIGHGHAISDVTGLQTALDGKAALSHTHAIANVTGLQTALDAKAPINDPTFTGTVTLPSGTILDDVILSGTVNGSSITGDFNAVINGNFDHWQYAPSQTNAGYGSDDRWRNDNSGTTKTHSRQSFALGQTDVPGNPEFFSRTVVSTGSGASHYALKRQRIEGVGTYAGETATLTFWAKADAAKNIAVEFEQNFGTGGSPSTAVTSIGVTTIALTTSWTKFSFTVSFPSIASKTLGSDGNDFLALGFWLDAGSDWDARTNSLGNQSGTFDIARVSLVPGDMTTIDDPTPRRHKARDLELCQRYHVGVISEIQVRGTLTSVSTSHYNSTTLALPTEMRVNPTCASGSSTTGSWDNAAIVGNRLYLLGQARCTAEAGSTTRYSFTNVTANAEL